MYKIQINFYVTAVYLRGSNNLNKLKTVNLHMLVWLRHLNDYYIIPQSLKPQPFTNSFQNVLNYCYCLFTLFSIIINYLINGA